MNSTINQAIAFDYGTTRIGVASGQSLTGLATPLSPLKARDGQPNWSEIEALLNEWQPDAVIVGIPLNIDGTISEMAYRARKFANRLHERYKTPCFLMDERLSTQEAKSIHFARGGSDNFKQESVDGIAAQLILESWFSSDKPIPSQTPLEEVYDLKHT